MQFSTQDLLASARHKKVAAYVMNMFAHSERKKYSLAARHLRIHYGIDVDPKVLKNNKTAIMAAFSTDFDPAEEEQSIRREAEQVNGSLM